MNRDGVADWYKKRYLKGYCQNCRHFNYLACFGDYPRTCPKKPAKDYLLNAKMKLIFDDWRRDNKSVYISEPELSMGSLHSGTTFDAKVNFTKDEIDTIAEAKKKGVVPVFRLEKDA